MPNVGGQRSVKDIVPEGEQLPDGRGGKGK